MKKQTVLIAGGTGLIGQNLKLHFQKLNYNVRILSRNKKSEFYWNPNENEFDQFLRQWLELYHNQKDYLFLFDTRKMNNIPLKYSNTRRNRK